MQFALTQSENVYIPVLTTIFGVWAIFAIIYWVRKRKWLMVGLWAFAVMYMLACYVLFRSVTH